jgi:hypothetical protein
MLLEATWQVFVLCCTIGLFLMWVLTLKKQIIGLIDENAKLKKALREKAAEQASGAKPREDNDAWGRKK